MPSADLEHVAISPRFGLSDAEATLRLEQEGFNEVPAERPRSLAATALAVASEPMFLLLIASGTVYLLLGDHAEAGALLAAVFMIIGITLYQERKTERALPGAYETMLAEVLAALAPHNHELAVELAEIPEHIRGYGHVKERHLNAAKAKEAELLSAFRNATPVGPKTVALAAD